MPLPPVALHAGITVLYPQHDRMASLFGVLGTVVCVETEGHLRALQAATCLMGPFYKTVLTAYDWMRVQGVNDEVAATFAGGFFRCVAEDSAHATTGAALAHLIAEQTPGGLNEDAIRRHTNGGCYDTQGQALDAVLARLEGASK